MKLLAIIPAYNEESTIGNVIKNTAQFVDEVLVINDGSTDKTIEAARDLVNNRKASASRFRTDVWHFILLISPF